MDTRLRTLDEWGNAHKAGELEKLKHVYADGSVYELKNVGNGSVVMDASKAAEYNNAVKADWTIHAARLHGEKIQAHMTEKNEWMTTAGIKEAHYIGEFVIEEGKVKSLHLEPTRETVEETRKALSEFSEWAAKTQPEGYSVVMPGGKLRYGAEAGSKLVELMHQWKRETR